MENIVSNFLVSTCRVHRKFDATKHCALISFDDVHSFGPFDTRTVSGSRAEFYIQPVNSCIHDLDIMLTVNPFLALDPSCEIVEIAGDLYDRIICYKHESYEQNKSFVRLRDPIVGVYDWSLEEYRFERLDVPANIDPMGFLPRGVKSGSSPKSFSKNFLKHSTTLYNRYGELTDMNEIFPTVISKCRSGPALTGKFQDVGIGLISEVDYVFSIFCPNWPPAADEWPIRTRHFGWPNSATISKVVHEGYDVVAAAHRDMRKDEYQRRLSFSRAEIILIQSWTPTQQIVYHLIRYFAKREIILKEGPENEEVVCTYHLKTLMLWSCEDKSAEWWDTSSVVAICCKMLRKLCECLKQKRCPNYFIPGANLLGHGMNSEVLNRTINTLDYYKDEKRITEWFIAHYILPVYQKHCNKEETVLTEEMVEICRICVCAYNKEQQLSDLNDVISLCAEKCFLSVNDSFNCRENHQMNIAFSFIPMKRFPDMSFASKMSNTLADYMKALILFQMSQSIMKPKFQFEVDILYEIWVHIIRRHLNFVEVFDFMQLNFGVLNKSELYFNRTEQMMKHFAFGYSKDEICFAKIVSILYLHKSRSCNDTSSHQIETASRMYMAALLYDIGRLQCAVSICSHVTTNFKENDDCGDVRYLKVNSLLFVDELATIAGFLLLRRNILRIRRKRIFLLSPELFAHHLLIRCKAERLMINELDGMTSSSEADCCLAAMLRYNILRCTDNNIHITPTYSRCTKAAEESRTDIVLPGKIDTAEILARISNDYMASFYASVSEEFGTKFNLASCYKALSLYQYRRYEDVIALCEKILEEPEHDSELEKFQFLNVNVSLHFIAYFDEDIQALIGFQLLVLRLKSMHHETLDNILADGRNRFPDLPVNGLNLPFAFNFMRAIFNHDDRNSTFNSSCKTFWETFNPILTKQFLGNYLKLRCLLDLGFPLFEVKSAFQCLKSSLLFEHILVHFMRQKIIRRYCGTATI